MAVSVLLIVLSSHAFVWAQQNSNQAVLSTFLKECYSEANLLNRNNLPPMTLPVMLDLIRKIEDHPSSIGDMRQISTGIVHLFRQDGIVYDPSIPDTTNVVPFSPTGYPSYKNRLLLNKLLPNYQFSLNTNILTSEEKCALHYMMSSSLLLHNRGDEERTCNQLNGPEIKTAQIKMFDKRQDVEIFNFMGLTDKRERQILGISNCPIETGVVSTPWGDVAMSTVITGISSGLEEQNVKVADLVSLRDEFREAESLVVNNRYASTLSGDIAEVAIRQGTTRFKLSVGAPGGWNSTDIKKHYFLTKNDDLELTNAEIRGGLDGLVLSELAFAYSTDYPELKLSQILDMYYSNNGILHEKRFRACNRKILVPDIASTQTLIDRSVGPAVALYHVSQLPSTTDLRGIQTFINNTIDELHRFLPLNLNESMCSTTMDQVIRPKVNLILITEPIMSRIEQISFIANEIEVGKYGSSISLMSIETGDLLIEKTFSLASFHKQLADVLVAQTGPVNLIKVLKSLRLYASSLIETEYRENYSGGNASIALFLTNTIPMAASEAIDAIVEAEALKRLMPDLRLVFATSSASESVVTPIIHYYDDFIPVVLNEMSQPSITLANLKGYLQTGHRRIVNPSCGIQWQNSNSGTVGFADYVDADGINYYRLLPNYFYGANINRLLRIESTDLGSINVCYSWSNKFPKRNRTASTVPADIICDSVANQGIVEIDLSNVCPSSSLVNDCPPLYLSVSSTTIPGKPQCKDAECRFPNDVKYLIVGQELSCYSEATALKIAKIMITLVILTFFVLR